MIFMENGIIGSYSIKDTIFADDNAILSLLYILESGKHEFFFALYPNDKCIMRATICRLHDSRYQLDFVIPESFVDEINIDDFFVSLLFYSFQHLQVVMYQISVYSSVKMMLRVCLCRLQRMPHAKLR